MTTHPDSILPASANPWGFSQVEGEVSRFVEGVDLLPRGQSDSIILQNCTPTSIKTVPCSLGPLQNWAGNEGSYVQSGYN